MHVAAVSDAHMPSHIDAMRPASATPMLATASAIPLVPVIDSAATAAVIETWAEPSSIDGVTDTMLMEPPTATKAHSRLNANAISKQNARCSQRAATEVANRDTLRR